MLVSTYDTGGTTQEMNLSNPSSYMIDVRNPKAG